MARGGIKAIIAAQFDDTGLRKAQKGIGDLSKTFKRTLGALGLGISFAGAVKGLESAAKAATADVKAQALLANQLKNTVGASDSQVAASERYIQKLQLQTSIVDDQLRPAMAGLVRATGDVTGAQKLLALATDVSAATGRDLGAVSLALGKAANGQMTALYKMIPSIKGSSDWMGALERSTKGAAEAAAKNDPFQRMSIIFQNLQEQIGTALLPYLEKMADFFASPEGQTALKGFADDVAGIAVSVADLASAIADTGVLDLLAKLVSGVSKVVTYDFAGAHDVAVNAILEGYKHKYQTDRAAFNRDLAAIKIDDAEYYKQIMAYVKTGSLAKYSSDETARLLFQRGIVPKATIPVTWTPNKLATATKTASDAASAAAKALAQAAQDAYDAAEKQAQAYLDAAKAAADLVAANKKLVASFQDVFKTKTELGVFESAAVDAFTSIFDEIDQALGDGQILDAAAANLTAFAKTTQSALAAIAKSRDILAGKIDIARTVTSGVMGLANITSFLETTTKSVTETVTTIINGIQVATTKTFDLVTSGGLVDNFQKIVDKTKAFAKNLLSLKALGLNKNLFAQLVNAGADAGGATAQAIVDGGSDTISALNSLYQELALSASDIASTATDTLYEVGQQVVSNGFIEGLMSQESALQQAAQTLADAFAATFSSDLKASLDAALPGAGAGLTGYPETMTGLAVGGGGGAVSTGFRAASLTLNISAGVVTDPNALAKTVIDSVKKYERSNGSVWVAA